MLKNISLNRQRPKWWWKETGQCPGETHGRPYVTVRSFNIRRERMSWAWTQALRIGQARQQSGPRRLRVSELESKWTECSVNGSSINRFSEQFTILKWLLRETEWFFRGLLFIQTQNINVIYRTSYSVEKNQYYWSIIIMHTENHITTRCHGDSGCTA